MSDFGNMPTLGDDQPPRNPNYNPVPPQRPVMMMPPPAPRGTSPLWILAAVAVGFLLPVCTCGVLFFSGIIGLGAAATQLEELAEATPVDPGSTPGVGVIDLQGVIYQGEGLQAASERMLRDIEWMDSNSNVRAIVVMANSPGGDANASDVVWQRLKEVNKPVYVAVDGLCASGCYYIAMGASADKIYATPNSLIGSIGVISTFFNIEELAEEIGVDVTVIATGENKDFGSLFRDMTPAEEDYWREQIAVIFDNFIQRVVEGRANHLNEAQVREVANGRVWAAAIAQDMGLIDGLMYPDEVMDLAATDAGLGSNYRVIESPYEPTFFDLLFSSQPGFSSELELPDTNDLTNMLQQSPIQYRYLGPYSGAEE